MGQQFALLYQLHGGGGGDGLGHRGDGNDAIETHGNAAAKLPLAKGTLIQGLRATGRHGGDAGHIATGHTCLKQTIQESLQTGHNTAFQII